MLTARKYLGIAAIAVSVAGMAGCDSAVGLDASANGSLAFAVDRVDTGLLGLSSSAPNEMTVDGHTLVLTSATMTASELELKGFAGGTSSGPGNATTSKFESGAVTVTIPVEGGTSREILADIAAGTYDKFEMDVQTVHLKGTYDGAPFDVTIAVNDEMESSLVPPLVVTDATSSTAVKVSLDLQSWFRTAAGGLLDPRQAASDTTIVAALRANIRGSFEASEDHERERANDDSGHDGSDD